MLHAALPRRAVFWALDRLKGGPISKHLADLQEFFRNPRTPGHIRTECLQPLLSHAAATTRFYRDYQGAAKLFDFPVIEKATIKKDIDSFLSNEFQRAELVPVSTSGSYGTPFTFHVTHEKRSRQRAEVIFFNQWADYDVGVRHILFRARKKLGITALMQNEIVLNPTYLTREWFESVRAELLQKKVEFLIGNPSALAALAHICESHGDKPEDFALRSIVTYTEPLPDSVRERIASALGCRVAARYSAEELGVLAHQTLEEKPYFVNSASYVVELLDLNDDTPAAPGHAGRIVVTDYFSHALPLIRYDTGDLGVSNDTGIVEKLDRIEGRRIERIWSTSDVLVSPIWIDTVMRIQKGIVQYQFIQDGKSRYTLKLVTMPGFAGPEDLERQFREILGEDAEIRVDLCETIPPLPSGKRPFIINKFRRGDGDSWLPGVEERAVPGVWPGARNR